MFFLKKDNSEKNLKNLYRYLAENNTKKVVAFANKIIKSKDMSKDTAFELAKIFNDIGNIQKTYELLKLYVIPESPSLKELKFFIIICNRIEKFGECLDFCSDYIKQDDKDLNILNIYLDCSLKENQLYTAIEILDKILAIQKNIIEFNELKFLKAKTLFDVKNYDEAEGCILDLLGADENNVDYLNLLALIYREKNLDDELITLLNKIYYLTNDISTARELTTLLNKLHRYSDLEKFVNTCSQTDFSIKKILLEALINLKKYDEALERVNQFLVQDEKNIVYYELKVEILNHKHQYNDAINVLNQAIDMVEISDLDTIDKLKGKTHILNSEYYTENNDYSKALSELTEAVKFVPNDSSLYFQYANLYEKTDDYNNAIQNLSKAIEINPNNYRFYEMMSKIFFKTDNMTQAIFYQLEAAKIAPENCYVLSDLAKLYTLIENYKSALIYFEKAYLLNKNNADMCYNLALCYHKINNLIEAKKYYSEALNINPEHKQAKINLEIANRNS